MSNKRLSTRYLGLELDNPLVPSASPLTATVAGVCRLAAAGAGAVVMHSLFEEACSRDHELLHHFLYEQEVGHGEADDYLPVPDSFQTAEEHYLEQLQTIKTRIDIPVIASLNGVSPRGWADHARELAAAGADALELNIYHIAASAQESGAAVEQRYLDILADVRSAVPDLPLALKLGAHFSSPVHLVAQLQEQGADAVVLFNRFLEPTLDLDTLKIVPQLQLSTAMELNERLRWTAIMRAQVALDIAITGGIHSGEDVIRTQLVGAQVAQLASVLMRRGAGVLGEMQRAMLAWMDENEYDSLQQLRGSVCHANAADPSGWERANYLDTLDLWRP
ncbi:MAG: dihydroorotate dehydrogenase-like protein [Oceanospirillales bacterium]|uniref:Dihydroorotate dehydrogenase (Fumarate) n=1 Tax=Marinobacterium halophilum TaxID=267374 RepID=A0A2P8EQW5_9GAMM|nr:dihydroorotate dehydrogenase-like protein [Marinobacterium halophilum]MBR9829085.1 dihydroorotate dehydrogenase-like protein [Oceanospirillales bacterium]PSL11843.1 dihydroorotate dehydrogenase (fumarate) [Marinobacterium halophilum]